MRISHKRLTIWKTTFAVLLPIYGHKCWKKSSKIGRPDWTTSEPAVAVLCRKSYLKSWRVIGRLESGQTQRSVADAVGVARSVVARLWNRFQETGNVRRRPGAGRPRATTSTDDRYIQLTARRNRTQNATQLQRQLFLATGRRVSS
ncbi:HTH_Tnp_Tc3_2 domain-containing protein [Trichonephila clavipes]|nr:HTH_Tnp_Tc3_2 domain-containing protein [Trichonephila clavipes]